MRSTIGKNQEHQEEKFNSLFNKGSEYSQAKNYSDAISCYTKALKYQKNWIVYYSRGMAHYQMSGDSLINAIDDFTHALEYEKNALIYCNRGIAYSEKNEWSNAIQNFTQAIECDTKSQIAYQNRGDAYYANNNYSQAFSDYDKVIELDPNNINSYIHRGIAYFNLKMMHNAISDYQSALNIDKSNFVAANNLGNVYFFEKKYHEAIIYYSHAIKMNPNHKSAYYNCGNAYNFIGKLEDAIACFEKAIMLDRSYAAAYCGLGDSYYRQDKILDAINLYYTAIQIDRNYRTTYDEILKVFKSEKLNMISKTDLFDRIKNFPVKIAKQTEPDKMLLFLLDSCLDSRTVLGKRFWKNEGIDSCSLEKGTLKEIYDYAKIINPSFSIKVDEYSPKKPINIFPGKNSIFANNRKLDELDQFESAKDMYQNL